ncbi:EP1-like glycoprotein 4, partial [Camellia sinensis]|uniref:EP1-like glycoprotein 4 n=1 Tax=Camellia sinensis TaxID=4442 RepID=UPI001036032C
IAKIIAEAVLRLDPQDLAPYVLLLNVQASSKRWQGVSEVRKVMRDRRVKEPAQNVAQTSIEAAGSSSLPPSFGPMFYLNSSFPSIWYNNDSDGKSLVSEDSSTTVREIFSRRGGVEYVCGFYCFGSCTYYLFSVAIVGGGNHSVVWSTNVGHPVKEGATLQLTVDGELELQNSDGDPVWSTNTLGKSVVGMNTTEWENLVLFNNKRAIVWQSFDYPTNTLLVGQQLYEDQKLISSSSNLWARALYFATLKLATDFVTYVGGKRQPQMYYQLVPDQTSTTSRGSYYAELQQGSFLVNFGTSQSMFKIIPINFPSTVNTAYIKLGSDGHLKIFHHSNANGLREIVDMITHDLGECQHPHPW